jgi:hypothetical protein
MIMPLGDPGLSIHARKLRLAPIRISTRESMPRINRRKPMTKKI